MTSILGGSSQLKINVGIIGAGGNSEAHHIPKLQAMEGVTIVAVANRTLKSAQRVADKFKIKEGEEEDLPSLQATDDWTKLIDDTNINAIVVGTLPHLHKTISIAALRAGKHILTEARMALNAREAKEMLDVSRQYPKLVAQIVPSPITFEYDATISNIIKAGSLGSLVYVEVKSVGGLSASPEFAEKPGSSLHWRHDAEYSGLNIGTLGIFYEALQRWIGDVSSVQALGKVVVGMRKDEASLELKAVHVPDHLDILATHPSGANVHLLVTSVLGTYQGLRSGFALYGTEGTLHLDLDSKKLTLAIKEEGKETDASIIKEVHVPDERKGKWRVEEEFVEAIRGQGKVSLTDFAKGAKYMEFTEAVTRALQTGSAVKLPLLDL